MVRYGVRPNLRHKLCSASWVLQANVSVHNSTVSWTHEHPRAEATLVDCLDIAPPILKQVELLEEA